MSDEVRPCKRCDGTGIVGEPDRHPNRFGWLIATYCHECRGTGDADAWEKHIAEAAAKHKGASA